MFEHGSLGGKAGNSQWKTLRWTTEDTLARFCGQCAGAISKRLLPKGLPHRWDWRCDFFLLSFCPGSMEYHIHHQQTILVLWACTHVLQHNFGIDICSKLGDDGHPALFVGSNLARASFKDLLEPLRRRVAKKTHHAAWQFSHETLTTIERSNPEIHGANSSEVTSVTMWTPSTVAFCLTVASWKAPPSVAIWLAMSPKQICGKWGHTTTLGSTLGDLWPFHDRFIGCTAWGGNGFLLYT